MCATKCEWLGHPPTTDCRLRHCHTSIHPSLPPPSLLSMLLGHFHQNIKVIWAIFLVDQVLQMQQPSNFLSDTILTFSPSFFCLSNSFVFYIPLPEMLIAFGNEYLKNIHYKECIVAACQAGIPKHCCYLMLGLADQSKSSKRRNILQEIN